MHDFENYNDGVVTRDPFRLRCLLARYLWKFFIIDAVFGSRCEEMPSSDVTPEEVAQKIYDGIDNMEQAKKEKLRKASLQLFSPAPLHYTSRSAPLGRPEARSSEIARMPA